MAGISTLFDIGRLALLANQAALQVTGHNIANVNTPGYTRQRVNLAATRPIHGRPGQIGTGVEALSVQRTVDRYLEAQITATRGNLGRLELQRRNLSRLEAAFNDARGAGIQEALEAFFAAVQDLTVHPEENATRSVVLSRAQTLAGRLNQTAGDLVQQRKDLNREIASILSQANDLAAQIADLNDQIARAENTGQQANDLRDARGLRLNDLAKILHIATYEDSLGQVTVLAGNGQPLVEGPFARRLEAVPDPANGGFSRVALDLGNTVLDITGAITSGTLRAALDLRDATIPEVLDRLHRFSAALADAVNLRHRQGYGLDGSTGLDFFAPMTAASSANTGGAVIGEGAITDVDAVAFDDYEIRFTGPAAYEIWNATTGTLEASGGYASGAAIAFGGWSVTITDGAGTPLAGDLFTVRPARYGAAEIAVALSDRLQIAASGSALGLPGDNANARALAAIQTAPLLSGGTATLSDAYRTLAEEVGVDLQAADQGLRALDLLTESLRTLREEVSGVSLDEELTSLMRYQRAYEASSRIVRLADELLQTVLELKP